MFELLLLLEMPISEFKMAELGVGASFCGVANEDIKATADALDARGSTRGIGTGVEGLTLVLLLLLMTAVSSSISANLTGSECERECWAFIPGIGGSGSGY